MSFGYSVGDFIAVCELAKKVRKRFVDSQKQFTAISDEVKSLSNVLRDLEDVLPERDLIEKQKADLYTHTQGCRNVLVELERMVDKYCDLNSSPVGFSNRSRKFWEKLEWEAEDVRDLRSRITSNTTLLNAFNGSLNNKLSRTTKNGVDRLNKYQDEQECRDNVNWLTSVNFSA
ncbi:MAG: hypothetical protein M1827_007553 [Pycnora praestabilis]|nr:MAG: hypothetical protein M1827_007553 [Pycnora praestabilis]